jgi:hypothetical protein
MKKSQFETMVDKAFWGLESKHGFKKAETAFQKHGCVIRFQNATTEVDLNYDIGSEPWLAIVDLENPKTNRSTLGWLLVEKGIDKTPAPEQAFHLVPLEEDKLEAWLQTKAQQLLDHGSDLLEGDFSLMPKLLKRAEKYEAECKRYIAIRQAKTKK